MRIVPGVLALAFVLTAHAAPAAAAPFDGKWIADIPAQGKCNYTGTATLMVAGREFTGEVHNGNRTLGKLRGKIEDNGDVTFAANGGAATGTGRFAADHFDLSWFNGQCDRHLQGVRAPSDEENAAQTADRIRHQAVYADLVKHAEAGDPVDYTALRAEAIYSKDWDFYDSRAGVLMGQAQVAAKGKDCATALEKLDQIIKLDFTIEAAHSLRSDCLKETGDHDRARIETAIADGLNHSLMDSGNGKSEETAYVVSSLREEMAALANRHIQLKTRQTEVRGSNGHNYDVVQGLSIGVQYIEPRTVYFDISRFATGRTSLRAAVQTAAASIR